MSIQLTPEQERRIRTVIDRGDYESVEEAVDAAIAAIEQGTIADFEGSDEELAQLIEAGAKAGEISEKEFWSSLTKRTSKLLAEYKDSHRS